MDKFDKPLERVLGEYNKYVPGPTVMFTCGIHGNEPSGVRAFQNLMKKIDKLRPAIKGRMIGLTGNIAALSEGERFIDVDLNRIWTDAYVEKLKSKEEFQPDNVEAMEQKELLQIMTQIFSESTGPVFVIDLHTTSSVSPPFLSINDTIRNRAFAMALPMPAILGMEEHLEGTILNYINELGHIAVGVEAGQHDDPASVRNHEAAMWLSLFQSGCIDPADVTDESEYHDTLAESTMNGKEIFEVRYRQNLLPKEVFLMNPGYTNFQKINRGEPLAILNESVLPARESGRLFMPLYQKQGNDGFFIIRQIGFFWLKLSEFLRRMKLDKYLHFLPGISKYEELNHALSIDLRIARWYVVEFFHLLGFRRKKRIGSNLIFIRREYDTIGPDVHKHVYQVPKPDHHQSNLPSQGESLAAR